MVRVVAAAEDPHPRNRGAGFELLEAAGIEVVRALDPDAAEALNPGHLKCHAHNRPYVRLKLAATMDGLTALPNGESQWITSAAARLDVQRLRAQSSAIVTGANTVLDDDPQLTVRDPHIDPRFSSLILSRARPVYVLDSNARTTRDARVYANPQARQVCGVHARSDHPQSMRINTNPAGRIDLSEFFAKLAAEGVLEVLVESGAVLAGAVLEAGLVDELVLYMAPKLMGEQVCIIQLRDQKNLLQIYLIP